MAKPGTFKGEKNPFYGKTHTPEAIRKIVKNRIGKPLSKEHKMAISKSMKKFLSGLTVEEFAKRMEHFVDNQKNYKTPPRMNKANRKRIAQQVADFLDINLE
jgi:NUMOD3 motif